MRLAFLHIPKTGGISVERAIERTINVADRAQICPTYRPDAYDEMTYSDAPDFGLYRGHFKWNFMASLPSDYVRAVVVRRPTDQILSLLNHIATRKEHVMHERVQGLDIAAFIAQSASTHNLQAKYLLGSERYRELCFNTEVPHPERVKQVVDEVRQNLLKVDVVGVTTHLPRFMKELSKAAGQNFAPIRRENANKEVRYVRDDLSEADIQSLQKATSYDRPIFQMVWEEFLKPKQEAAAAAS